MKPYNKWKSHRVRNTLIVYSLIMGIGCILAGVEFSISTTALYAAFVIFGLIVFAIAIHESSRDNYIDYRYYLEKDEKDTKIH